MTTREEICREVFAGKRWFLFQHGTVLVAGHPAAGPNMAVAGMEVLAKLIGPYGGEGSEWGDCRAMKLKNFDGWLVDYPIENLALMTIVFPEDLPAAPATSSTEVMQAPAGFDPLSMRVALCGRAMRNADVRDPKVVASGEVK